MPKGKGAGDMEWKWSKGGTMVVGSLIMVER